MKHISKYIIKEFSKHTLDYLVFLTVGLLFLLTLNFFKGQRFAEFIVIAVFAIFYIIWAIYHHLADDTLHFHVVIEYVFFAFIALFLLSFIVFA